MNIFQFVNIQLETTTTAAKETGETVSRSYSDLILGYDPSTGEYSLSNLIVMLILMVLLGVTIFIFIERFLTIRKSLQGEQDFMRQVKSYVEDGKLDAAVQLCRSTDNPVARMVEKGILRIGKPMDDIATSVENVAKMEVYSLEARMSVLATISGVAPMLGMLGTVLGMVGTLAAMAATGSPSIQDISGGIYEAMVTTIGGLVVGILAYVSYNYLVSKVEKVIQKMEGGSMEFLDILEAPGK
ncbi:MotA/TolQ/ExbB proton channel family protein [Parvicella tangerina]|uniref:Tol-Pal system protein TolQ n=1 Tax=Parvicella tangerina TaxID=2829795 RepID=A0A916JLT6_9FLAO|nr:MotA/TolQ/ExbB proton channel family protein [Parvicella tangerina]CAG5080444.1 Tol-Pal system protein TolQ [Parvicella tangerina]